MKSKYQTLAGNTVKLGLGTFGSKFLVFLMVRFYTEYLSPADYGTADLITQTANLLIPIVSLGITDAVFRFAMDKAEDPKCVFTAGVRVIAAGSFILAAIASFAAGQIDNVWLITVFMIASNFHALCAQFIRARGEMTLFAVQGLINTVLVIALNILFLAVFRFGVTGYVLSTAAADLITTCYLVIRMRLWRFISGRPTKALILRMLRYCVPLIPTAVFWWITSVSDRYMITAWIGSAANGVYAVASKLPTILTVLSTVFMDAWLFSAVTECREGSEEHLNFYSSVWRTFLAGMVLSSSGVIAFSRLLVRLLADEEFFSAWQYVPVLCLAMVFAAFSTFLSSVYVVSKKSSLSFWTAMLGAVSNVILNLILIPRMGVMGAAIATLISYVLVFILRAVSIRRLLPFSLAMPTVILDVVILTAQAAALSMQSRGWIAAQALCIAVLLVLNLKPLLLAADKLFGIGRKGANL